MATGQGDDYTAGCVLDYHYFKENYKMTAIDSSKQHSLDADPRAMQQIKWKFRSCRNCFGLFARNCKSNVNVLYNNLVLFNIKNDSIQ